MRTRNVLPTASKEVGEKMGRKLKTNKNVFSKYFTIFRCRSKEVVRNWMLTVALEHQTLAVPG